MFVHTMIQTKVLELFYNVVALAKFDDIGKIYFTEGNLTFDKTSYHSFSSKARIDSIETFDYLIRNQCLTVVGWLSIKQFYSILVSPVFETKN